MNEMKRVQEEVKKATGLVDALGNVPESKMLKAYVLGMQFVIGVLAGESPRSILPDKS